MASIKINLGDAFLLETPPNGQHLYVAIAPTTNGKYLFANLTTRRPNSETACILLPNATGMPSYVRAESVIAYGSNFIRELDANQLDSQICVGSNRPKCTFPPDILTQIQLGGLKSKRLPKMYREYIRSALLG